MALSERKGKGREGETANKEMQRKEKHLIFVLVCDKVGWQAAFQAHCQVLCTDLSISNLDLSSLGIWEKIL